jgi:ABC-type Fe3+-hydroxamate transport system substrate-binding protein
MILQSTLDLKNKPCRIISLVPSQTELLAYLGVGEQTIGITKFCVHPKEWRATKTIIGGTKNINLEKIKKLQPDLIIANKEENVQQQVETLAAQYDVWVTDVKDVKESFNMISDVGELTHTTRKAKELVVKIQAGFKQISVTKKTIKTCYLIWRNPFMCAGGGTFIHDMLTKCGLQNIFASAKRYPVINIKELQAAHCKLLILSSEPYPFQQKHIKELQEQLPYTKILLADGEMFSWYGSRLLYAPQYFNKLLQDIQEV